MDFGTAIKTCLKEKYCCFEGRARRSEYWYFALFNFLIGLVLGWIPILGWIISLGLFLPSLSAGVRRLHDTGRSGWWYLIILIPLLGGIALLVFCCLDSQPGANKWGNNPKEVA